MSFFIKKKTITNVVRTIQHCWLTGVSIDWKTLYQQIPLLTSLTLKNSQLVGSLNEAFYQFNQLQFLDLSGNYFTGELSSSLRALSQLKYV